MIRGKALQVLRNRFRTLEVREVWPGEPPVPMVALDPDSEQTMVFRDVTLVPGPGATRYEFQVWMADAGGYESELGELHITE